MKVSCCGFLLLLGLTGCDRGMDGIFGPRGPATTFEIRSVAEWPGENAVELPEAPGASRAPGGKVAVEKAVLMDGSELDGVFLNFGQMGWQIMLQFTRAGATRFAKISAEHVQKRLALIADGEVISAPVVNEPITGGTVAISGSFSEPEARALADKLKRARKR